MRRIASPFFTHMFMRSLKLHRKLQEAGCLSGASQNSTSAPVTTVCSGFEVGRSSGSNQQDSSIPVTVHSHRRIPLRIILISFAPDGTTPSLRDPAPRATPSVRCGSLRSTKREARHRSRYQKDEKPYPHDFGQLKSKAHLKACLVAVSFPLDVQRPASNP